MSLHPVSAKKWNYEIIVHWKKQVFKKSDVIFNLVISKQLRNNVQGSSVKLDIVLNGEFIVMYYIHILLSM